MANKQSDHVVRDLLLTILLPPIGMLFTGSGLVRRDERARRSTGVLAVTALLFVIGLWLTFVLVGLTFFRSSGIRQIGG